MCRGVSLIVFVVEQCMGLVSFSHGEKEEVHFCCNRANISHARDRIRGSTFSNPTELPMIGRDGRSQLTSLAPLSCP